VEGVGVRGRGREREMITERFMERDIAV